MVALMRESTAAVTRTAYSVDELAERAGVPKSRVYRLVEEKKIPAFPLARQWRIRAEDMEPAVKTLMADEPLEPWLSVREVAAQWGISERAVWRLIASGALASELRAGERRIAPEVARAYIDNLVEQSQAQKQGAAAA